jgi:hypothetical protein
VCLWPPIGSKYKEELSPETSLTDKSSKRRCYVSLLVGTRFCKHYCDQLLALKQQEKKKEAQYEAR